MLIAMPNLSDAATLTGAATAGDMSLSNLQAQQPTDRARFASLTGMYTQWDLGAPKPIRLIWHGYSNASVNATVRTRAATSAAGLTTSPPIDRTESFWCSPTLNSSIWQRPHYFKYSAAAETYQHWRFDYSDPSNPNGYLEIGRVYLSDPWVSAYGAQYGAVMGTQEPVVRLVTQGGQVIPMPQTRSQASSFSVTGLSEGEADDEYTEIARLRGVSQDILVWHKHTSLAKAMHKSVYGVLNDVHTLTVETGTPASGDIYGVRIEIIELPFGTD